MPIHLEDLDVLSGVNGLKTALIVPCNMCPAVTVAVKQDRPFIQLFRKFLKSPPFSEYVDALQKQLSDAGVTSSVFRSDLPHQWFVCMWTAGRRRKLKSTVNEYDAAIVLGCDTATETVRESTSGTNCRVIEGMEVTGFMNARMSLSFPCDICFSNCRTVPLPSRKDESN